MESILSNRVVKAFTDLYKRRDEFYVELGAEESSEQIMILQSYMIMCLEPYSKTLPLLRIPNYYIHSFLYMGHPASQMFLDFQVRLCQLHVARLFLYETRNQAKVVMVWESDYNQLSKRMKMNLERLDIEFTEKQRELRESFMSKVYPISKK